MVLNNNNSRNKLEKFPCFIRVLYVFYPSLIPVLWETNLHPFSRP